MNTLFYTKNPEQFEAVQMEGSVEGTVGNGPDLVAWVNSQGTEAVAIYYDELEETLDGEGNLIQPGRPEFVRIVGTEADLSVFEGQYLVRGDHTWSVYSADEFSLKFSLA